MHPTIKIRKVGATEEIILGTHSEKGKIKNITREIKPELKEIIKSKGLDIKQVIDFVDYGELHEANKAIIDELVQGELIKEPTNNKCYFIEGNEAWVSEDPETFKYRYFSRNNNEYFFLDILDLFLLFSDKSYGDTVTDLISSFGFQTNEENWKEEQRQKYLGNIVIIQKAEEWKEKYPELYKLTKSCLITLLKLNTIGLQNIVGFNESVDGESVFFSSYGYLAEFMGKGRTTIRDHINFLTLLGLVRKPKTEEIPEHMLERSIEKSSEDKRIKKCIISYFTIQKLTKDKLAEIEKMATNITNNGFSIRDMTLNNVLKVFGEEIANNIYGNNRNNTEKVTKAMQKKSRIRNARPEDMINEEGYINEPNIPF